MNPRRHHRYRRNPAFLGLGLPPVKTVLYGAVGFVSPPLVSGFLTSFAPSIVQTVTSMGLVGKYVMKAATIGGVAYLVKRFAGPAEATSVLIGGGVNVAMSLAYDFAPGLLPSNPLAMYLPVRPGMQAYTRVRPGLNAAPMMRAASIPTAAPFANLMTSGKYGSALRYQRY